MKAAYYKEFGDLDQIEVDSLGRPDPGEGEVMVRIKAAGVNPVDAAVTRGYLKDFLPQEFPSIPGWDMAGVVEARGHAARRFEEGDEVYAYARRPTVQWGTFAEYIVLPESYLSLRPQSVSMEAASGIPLVGLTAYQSLFDAGELQEGQSVLILGASGGVGTLAIQLAKAQGAEVIGVASEKNHEYMRELGADATIDYRNTHVGKAVNDKFPEGVDLVFDTVSGETLQQAMEALKDKGKLVSIKNHGDELVSKVDFEYVFVEPNATQLDHIRELTEDGKIKVPVSKTFSLDETVEALRQIGTLHTRGKIVITP